MPDENAVPVKLSTMLQEGADAPVEGEVPPEGEEPVQGAPRLPAAAGEDVPDWAVIPQNMRVPPGRQVVFLKFPPAWLDNPLKGERQCICWSLSDADEKLAADRCEGKAGRAPAEFSKQMIRAVDGMVVDWSKTKGPGSLDEFWREIGPKARNMLQRVYTQLHLASDDETRDFFEHCVAVRTAG